MDQLGDIATLIASILVILAAVGATARWAVKGTIDNAIKPLRDEIHAIDVRLARVEASVKHLAPPT